MPSSITVPNRTRLFFLVLSTLLGGVIAVGRHAELQVSLESAQVLAGLVRYPADIPFYTFHLKGWTLLSQLSTALLSLGLSEVDASLLIGAAVGAVSFAALFLVSNAICEKPPVSFFIVLLIYTYSLTGIDVAYPIALLGTDSCFGILSLSYMLLTIGCLGNGYYRTGAFLTGLAVSFHPAMGAFCTLVSCVSVILNFRALRPQLRRMAVFFTLGLACTFASLLWQLQYVPHLPALDSSLKRTYLEAFIRNFDYHRTVGRWLSKGVLLGVLISALAYAAARLKEIPPSARVVCHSIIASVAVTMVLVTAADLFPQYYAFKIVIPWRYMNYANLCLVPVSLGILAAEFTPRPRLRALAFMAMLFLIYRWRASSLPNDGILYAGCVLTALGVVVPKLPDLPDIPFRYLKPCLTLLMLAVLVIMTLKQVVPAFAELPAQRALLVNRWYTRTIRTAAARSGTLLTAGHLHLIQLVTRRPVLLDGQALDIFPYILDTGPRFNEILRQVYGLDIFVTPPEETKRGVESHYHQLLWERRSPEEWVKIRKEFGVTDILTYDSWHLQLPVIASDSGLTLYTIP